jgi:5'-nucleotidase
VRDRRNVILLGDSIDDVGMVQGFDYDNLITVGFLNDKVAENLERYKKAFDVVLIGDASMGYVRELLEEIIK